MNEYRNEYRNQRRKHQKLPYKRVKPICRVITLIIAIITLGGVFVVFCQATSYANERDAPHSQAIIPFEGITLDLGATEQSDYYKTFDFPSYIYGMPTAYNQVEIEQDNDTVNIYDESFLRKFYQLQWADIPTLSYNTNIHIDLTEWTLPNGDMEGYIYLSNDPEYGYTQISSMDVTLYAPQNLGSEVGDYEQEANFGNGTYKVYITFENEDYATNGLAFDNSIDTAYKGNYIGYNYIQFESDYYYDPQHLIESLYNRGELSELQYKFLIALFVNSTFPLTTTSKYDTPINSFNFNTTENSTQSYNKAYYTSNLNRLTSTYNSQRPASRFSMTLSANNYFMRYSDYQLYNRPYIIVKNNTTSTIKVQTSITWAYVNRWYNEDVEEYVTSITTDSLWTERLQFYKGDIIYLMPNLNESTSLIANWTTSKKLLYIINVETKIWFDTVEDIELSWYIPYVNEFSGINFNSWLKQQTGSDFPISIQQNYIDKVVMPNDFLTWLAETTSSVFDVTIFGSTSIGDICWFVIGVSLLFVVLKFFAGG